MLKAQLSGKMARFNAGWRRLEDILTGDFFGALDYLPRRPYLREFVDSLCRLNAGRVDALPRRRGVDWEATEVMFWPLKYTDDEGAEPDLVLVSNRWILVVEVKLESGLDRDQPRREYCIGKAIARERGVPTDAVYYVTVSRGPLNVAATFSPSQHRERDELLSRYLRMLWSQAALLVKTWVRCGIGGAALSESEARMLQDLAGAMRKRRAIAFSGFSFADTGGVAPAGGPLFCPPGFEGFLSGAPPVRITSDASFLLSRARGFLHDAPRVHNAAGPFLAPPEFSGFLGNAQLVECPGAALLGASRFGGFLGSALPCRAAPIRFLNETKGEDG